MALGRFVVVRAGTCEFYPATDTIADAVVLFCMILRSWLVVEYVLWRALAKYFRFLPSLLNLLPQGLRLLGCKSTKD